VPNHDVMVTVIVLCYNHEPYLRQALDSIVSQETNFPFEVIVHDDASTDRSADIIREYEARYPHLLRPICQTVNQYQQGIPIRRVHIDHLIRGKYVAICESDDYWCDSKKLQKQVDFLESHPEYAACTHNCIIVDENSRLQNRIMDIYRPYRAHRYNLRRFALGAAFPGQTATLLCRHTAYVFESKEQENAFWSLRIPTGDKRLFLKLLLWGDIHCMEEPMSAHRVVTQSGDSWSARNHGRNLSFSRHAAAVDMRRYAREKGLSYPNSYTVFHTGLACIGKYLIRPIGENKEVFHKMTAEHGGIFRTALYLLGMGILAIPNYFAHKREITRYDPEK